MCRCRTFKDKEHLLYIQHNKASNIKPETAADAWDELDNAGRSLCVSNKENEGVYKIRSPIDITYRLNDQSQGLKFYLNAWRNQVIAQAAEYILSRMEFLGYRLEYVPHDDTTLELISKIVPWVFDKCTLTQEILD